MAIAPTIAIPTKVFCKYSLQRTACNKPTAKAEPANITVKKNNTGV
nr:hypothetical protein [Glaesserella parasuis]